MQSDNTCTDKNKLCALGLQLQTYFSSANESKDYIYIMGETLKAWRKFHKITNCTFLPSIFIPLWNNPDFRLNKI